MNLEPATRHAGLDDAAIDAAGLFGIPAELVDAQRPFPLGLRDRLAGFGRDHARRFIGPADHLVRDPVQSVRAVEGRQCTPFGEARLRRGDGGLCIDHRCDRTLPEGLFRDRAEDRRCRAIGAATPRTVDEETKMVIHQFISPTETTRPSLMDFSAASARTSARRPSSKPTEGARPASTASTNSEISASKASR